MREIEKANQRTLYGIFGDGQWANKDRLSHELLIDLIDHFSRVSLSIRNVVPDVLGQAYEYLIKKFADATNKKARTVEIKIAARLRRHKDNPLFIELGERLEDLKERHERGAVASLQFIKELIVLATAVVESEKKVDPVEEQNRAKAALTELLNEVKTGDTPVVAERIVNDIDAIVRLVRFDGWQQTSQGERKVKQALRKTLYRYKLHQDQDLFDRAYGYIAQYY